MTRAEIFIQTISEVSGKPKAEVAELLSHFRKSHPGGTWDDIVPDHEAQKLITDFRKEAPGILAWLARGVMEVAKHESGTIH
ncbi:hypothetical protein [Desulfobulbus elongatus]|uniref:hypothetical protein n=1 Tax=Desulfobulbus elongatus TaxID=53332 RepID=UPI0012FC823A|nr:hypothetical protein [Desulfobulbus elongatus]